MAGFQSGVGSLGGLVLPVVVDGGVPAGYHVLGAATLRVTVLPSLRPFGEHSQQGLVTVAPGEVLGADVLVGVLNALLQGRHVGPVLPVLVPEVPGIHAGEQEGGTDGAAGWSGLVGN